MKQAIFFYLFAILALGCSGSNRGKSRLFGLDFSPFTTLDDPGKGARVGLLELSGKLEKVAPFTRWIRTYSVFHGLGAAGRLAHGLGLKAAIGAWIGRDGKKNEEEIEKLISLATLGEVDLAIVGSEVLYRRDVPKDKLISYIKRVKKAIPMTVPVTTAETYEILVANRDLIEACDLVFVNYYPFTLGLDPREALKKLEEWHENMKRISKGKEVIVSETGWPTGGEGIRNAIPSPENSARYLEGFLRLAGEENLKYFYFEAFDEPWKKRHEGEKGTHWGLFSAGGNLKRVSPPS